MTYRWTDSKRLKLLELAVQRYASHCGWSVPCCLICGKTQFKPRELTLDHLDSNKRNNRPENINILCRGCNVAEENRRRAGHPRFLTAETLPNYLARLPVRPAPGSQLSVCVNGQAKAKEKAMEDAYVRGAPNSHTRYELAPRSSLEVNQIKEPRFVSWVYHLVESEGGVSTEDGVLGSAQVIGASQVTTQKYFDKITNRFGWLQWGRKPNGEAAWVFRQGKALEDVQREMKGQAEGL